MARLARCLPPRKPLRGSRKAQPQMSRSAGTCLSNSRGLPPAGEIQESGPRERERRKGADGTLFYGINARGSLNWNVPYGTAIAEHEAKRPPKPEIWHVFANNADSIVKGTRPAQFCASHGNFAAASHRQQVCSVLRSR